MSNFLTVEEEKIVTALKNKIASLHSDVQAALVREVSWIERNLWPYTAVVLIIGLGLGWAL